MADEGKLTDAQVIGLAVRRVRERRGVSRKEVWQKGDIGSTTLARIEQGKQEATWATLRRIARGIGVPQADIQAEAAKIERGQ
jgi:transcriptional regulator with XRE-family HTH domain